MIIAVDFDGTLVDHRFPDIGPEVPGAFAWLREFQALGAKLILWTMRSDGRSDGDYLKAAAQFCADRGIKFFGINWNPEQESWTSSPKAYANIYIDDAAFGCPLALGGHRPYVDWSIVGPEVVRRIKDDK